MLTLKIKSKELFDEVNQKFLNVEGGVLKIEHSLLSISKWESIFKKPFFDSDKTDGESVEYIRCMVVEGDEELVYSLDVEELQIVYDYINDVYSATIFNGETPPSKEIITSEIIYFWMVTFQIPFETERWNIKRLFNLIKICEIKNSPKKKMSINDIYKMNRELNEKRKSKYNTRG